MTSRNDSEIADARLPVIVVGAMLVLAVILGVVNKTIDADLLTRPTASISDPVTIP